MCYLQGPDHSPMTSCNCITHKYSRLASSVQCSAKVLTLEAVQIAVASTTKKPFDAGHLDAGHFDAGHFDAGHFDAGHMPVFRNAVTATNARLQNVVLWSMWLSSRSVIPNIKHGLDSTWKKV